jgi:hypothetical protein
MAGDTPEVATKHGQLAYQTLDTIQFNHQGLQALLPKPTCCLNDPSLPPAPCLPPYATVQSLHMLWASRTPGSKAGFLKPAKPASRCCYHHMQ